MISFANIKYISDFLSTIKCLWYYCWIRSDQSFLTHLCVITKVNVSFLNSVLFFFKFSARTHCFCGKHRESNNILHKERAFLVYFNVFFSKTTKNLTIFYTTYCATCSWNSANMFVATWPFKI